MSRTAVLIVAAGVGERAGGGIPKQYRLLHGLPMLRRSVLAFAGHPGIAFVQVMIGPGQESRAAQALDGIEHQPFVTGGETRQETVRRGLEALAEHKPDFVLIHDAARPFVSRALIDALIAALKVSPAAVPLVAVADTLKRETSNGVWTTVPRDGLFRAQTPQAFHFDAILKAHRAHANESVTDDMALAELAGLKIANVPGEEVNTKMTRPEDFDLAERWLAGAAEFRTGMGLDAHRFVAGDHVWLGGIKISHDHTLEGHSDADAGLHALTDAILGAIGQGDIGQHFPPTDQKWRGASSSLFLEHAAKLVREAGGEIVHCDLTLICERPKISPHREAMQTRVAEILGIDRARVSIKATTTEGMGFTGRREGLAAQAIATVRLPRA
ncbi:MAG TPA: bifunctional 2-C-methyl-D-erythritol 4-phosphate cytidylyltransferase/2-C-methyl-D-erythritol 2,4-cyclodiphosphate synthase [Rhizomicrobium sp.]|nr:bifunctional 2-C-methyl-D-erythritol 4-phosphate cytidylyltransferase/2-C-methyl-D-erythritol 2,4-cyclodiphosphate synthase [Rhizomicrobium sp.]